MAARTDSVTQTIAMGELPAVAVTLRAGDCLIVELPATPGTGFRWEVQAHDGAVVDNLDPVVVPGDRPGGSSRQRFGFRARAPGEVQLTLRYWRRWIGESSVRRLRQVSITVVAGPSPEAAESDS